MPPISPGLSSENAEKSLALASALFPDGQWVYKEPGIWVAKSRLLTVENVQTKLTGELKNTRDKGRCNDFNMIQPVL